MLIDMRIHSWFNVRSVCIRTRMYIFMHMATSTNTFMYNVVFLISRMRQGRRISASQPTSGKSDQRRTQMPMALSPTG